MQVLVFEATPAIRGLLAYRIAALRGVEVVGDTDVGPQAMESIAALMPDLVLLDLSRASERSGAPTPRRLRERGFAGQIWTITNRPSHRGSAMQIVGADRCYDNSGGLVDLMRDIALLTSASRTDLHALLQALTHEACRETV